MKVFDRVVIFIDIKQKKCFWTLWIFKKIGIFLKVYSDHIL